MEKPVRNMVNDNYIWRVVFTFLIVIGHCGWIDISQSSYYIGVDYFFIISGLFLAKGVIEKNESEWSWLINKVKKMYPYLVYNFMIYFMFIYRGATISEKLHGFIFHLNQLLPMMYFVLPSDGSITYLNFAVWYISVLLLMGMVIHYVYSKNRNVYLNFIAPILLCLLYGYLSSDTGSFNTGRHIGPFLNDYYLRGLVDMTGGVLVFEFLTKNRERMVYFSTKTIVLFRFVELVIFSVLLYGIRNKGNGANDIFFVLLIYLLVLCSFVYGEKNYFRKFKCMNDLMYPVYISHLLVISILNSNSSFVSLLNHNKGLSIAVFFLILLVYSYCTNYILGKVIKVLNGVFKRSKNC